MAKRQNDKIGVVLYDSPWIFKGCKSKKVSWLWKPYIAFGKVTLIQGDTGIGKTSLLIKVIADLSNGVYPPTMFRECLQPQEKGKPLTTFFKYFIKFSLRSTSDFATIYVYLYALRGVKNPRWHTDT